MSELSPFCPQPRTLVGAAGTAASCQEATYASQQTAPLFDHLVGAASRVGGTSRLSALAVLRLMRSSNLVGNRTGRSAGFAPLRMRPV